MIATTTAPAMDWACGDTTAAVAVFLLAVAALIVALWRWERGTDRLAGRKRRFL